MKPIQTFFKGYRFRSRTEARWAVFLDALQVKFVYEPEGLVVGDQPYLPDFWLPEYEVWIEIKGAEPTAREVSLCRLLCEASRRDVFLQVGPPWENEGYRFMAPEGIPTDLDLGLERVFALDMRPGIEAAKRARFEFDDNGAGPAPRRRLEKEPLWKLYR